MIPQRTIDELITKHSNLEKDLSSGRIEKSLFAEKSKEYADLNEIIDIAKKFKSFEKDKLELEKILTENIINKVVDEVEKKVAELKKSR